MTSNDRPRPAGFATRAIHEGDWSGPIAEEPVSPPIWLTADYLYEGLDHYADVINERRPGFVYGRYGNPTHVSLNRLLASLEGAEAVAGPGAAPVVLRLVDRSLLVPPHPAPVRDARDAARLRGRAAGRGR